MIWVITVDANNYPMIYLHRYTAHLWQREKIIIFDNVTHVMTNVVGKTKLPTNGFFIDSDRDIKTGSPIVFIVFRLENKIFFAIDGKTFDVLDSNLVLLHVKGFLLSTFSVKYNNLLVSKHTYITPWWRIFLDDGMFPENRFPLEVMGSILKDSERLGRFLEKWQEPK